MDHKTDRRHVLRMIGCGGATLIGFRQLTQAQSLSGRRKDSWTAAQPAISDASHMTTRIARSLDGLTSLAAAAATTRDKLKAELTRLSDEIAKLTAAKDDLLDEYRKGLFCSGCGQTKSQILAKGESFPHSGQTIIRPTQAQIDAKERELQAPIDRAERSAATSKKNLDEATSREDAAFTQIRQGLALWRTSATYWRASVYRGQRDREAELNAELTELQKAMQAERDQQSRQTTPVSKEKVDSDAQVWVRLMNRHQEVVDAFREESGKAHVTAFNDVRDQRAVIDGYLRKNPLPKTLLSAVVTDAPVSPALSSGELGVNYQLGDLSVVEKSRPMAPPPLRNVEVFVSNFKSAGLPNLPDADSGPGVGGGLGSGIASGGSMPAATPAQAQPASPSASNNRLLRALP